MKYRLIKEYPGSPKLGTVVMNGIIGVNKNNPNLSFDGSRRLRDIELPHKYPEFWEEVIEKDYEILSIYDKISNRILTDSNVQIWINKPFTRQNWEIHSVKRLSDGEVFTVGDRVDHNYYKGDPKIEKLYFIEKDRLSVYIGGGWNVPISNIEHIKKPLFTTEDGVDIYEGDKYFQLALTFKPNFREAIYEKIARPYIMYSYNCKKGKEQLNKNGIYYFSSKEAAEEFVLMNKPCLSINEVMNVAYNPTETFTSTSNKLKKLVKSKL